MTQEEIVKTLTNASVLAWKKTTDLFKDMSGAMSETGAAVEQAAKRLGILAESLKRKRQGGG